MNKIERTSIERIENAWTVPRSLDTARVLNWIQLNCWGAVFLQNILPTRCAAAIISWDLFAATRPTERANKMLFWNKRGKWRLWKQIVTSNVFVPLRRLRWVPKINLELYGFHLIHFCWSKSIFRLWNVVFFSGSAEMHASDFCPKINWRINNNGQQFIQICFEFQSITIRWQLLHAVAMAVPGACAFIPVGSRRKSFEKFDGNISCVFDQHQT